MLSLGVPKTPKSGEERQSLFVPVRQRRAFEEIVLQVEDAIMEGRLSVGDRLPPERELAEICGVSRPAVREAMRVLEAFGVIVARRGNSPESGSFVSSTGGTSGLGGLLRLYTALMHIPLSDLIEVRVALEAVAIRSAVATASETALDKLDAVMVRMTDATDRELFLEVDTEFHLTLAELSDNSALELLMGAMREAIATQMLRAFERLENFERERQRLLREHARLIEIMRSRDEGGAVAALSEHIRNFYSRVMRPDSKSAARDASPTSSRPNSRTKRQIA